MQSACLPSTRTPSNKITMGSGAQEKDASCSTGEHPHTWAVVRPLDRSARFTGPYGCPYFLQSRNHPTQKLPDAELVYLFMNQEIALSTLVEWLNESESKRSLMKLSGNVKYLINNLASVRKLLISTLITYEHDYFGQEWDYIEPFMNISAAQFQDLASRSPEKALNTLHPRLLAENGTLTVQKAVTYYFPYDQLGQVYVFPSTFIFPHLLVGWYEDTLFLPLTVDVPGLAFSEGPPSDLLRQLKALSDDTRMRILKLLWKSPHCTKQLAPILGISEAAVSKQLKQLSEAGFTQSQRKGNYLFYSVNKEVFDNLLVLQRQYLEQ